MKKLDAVPTTNDLASINEKLDVLIKGKPIENSVPALTNAATRLQTNYFAAITNAFPVGFAFLSAAGNQLFPNPAYSERIKIDLSTVAIEEMTATNFGLRMPTVESKEAHSIVGANRTTISRRPGILTYVPPPIGSRAGFVIGQFVTVVRNNSFGVVLLIGYRELPLDRNGNPVFK